jgi:REP element-mobilizing transposase RayT
MICQIKMRLRRPVQQDIPFRTHGGKRAGAGRPKDMARSLVSHARRPEVAGTTPVHVTLRVRPEVLNLRSGRSFRLIEKALVALRAARDARVVHYSVQGNHVHLVMEADDRRALGRRVQGLEIRIARAMNRLMGRKRGTVFADRYHARALRTPLEVKRALEYVLKNRRHHVGARAAAIDAYSSADCFDGWRGLVPTIDRARTLLVRRPRSWLLRVGWRRHGLLTL